MHELFVSSIMGLIWICAELQSRHKRNQKKERERRGAYLSLSKALGLSVKILVALNQNKYST